MSQLLDPQAVTRLYMGNEAIARGALEAGVAVVAGYPGTPSSEIVQNLASVARERNLYVEWSVNEKVAVEVAAAASFTGLRSLCTMKQNGVDVAADFLLHLGLSGVRGGMVLAPCDDPGGLSSANEGESRQFARLLELPLLEPGDFQEAKDMIKWAFDLSEELGCVVMVRSVTRLSHASGDVILGELPSVEKKANFKHRPLPQDPQSGPMHSFPVPQKHQAQQRKLERAVEIFEASPFNTYEGPEQPELLVVTSSACTLYAREAIDLLGVQDRVGLLKLGTTWPLPPKLLGKHLKSAGQILVIEEVIPFLEENVKILASEMVLEIGPKKIMGKRDGQLPMVGELNPDLVIAALAGILDTPYQASSAGYAEAAAQVGEAGAPPRELAFCAGCPHRASLWSLSRALELDGRDGFVCGDVGCYSMAIFPTGFQLTKTLHAMGSGIGVTSGFGKLEQFGMGQPALAICGDSTFFHAAIPALVNAVHNQTNATLVLLDNSGTAMTGFQPHPGLPYDAMGNEAIPIDPVKICESLGAKVRIQDPFDLEQTEKCLLELLAERDGVNVMILRKPCALSPERKKTKDFEMSVDKQACLGESCGCNRLCTRVFKCPGLVWDSTSQSASIDEVVCIGCGVCASICPVGAIKKAEAAK